MGHFNRADNTFIAAVACLSIALLGSSFLAGDRASAAASTWTADFSSAALFDAASSTGHWNIAEERLQAAVAKAGAAGDELDFGDGRHGAFSDGANLTSIGITVTSPTTITLDTSVESNFQFTSFNLSAGVTLTVSGPNALRIRVLGSTTIDGSIVMDGGDGDPNSLVASSFALGGTGVAGGSDGGNSGNTGGGAGTQGFPTGAGPAAPLGGRHGNNVAIAGTERGGGGGCNGAAGTTNNAANGANNAASAGNCGATTRANVGDAFESTFTGGAGGGGGGAFVDGAGDVTGSGGGAGGGAIHIRSLGDISIAGSISAQGGNGGTYDDFSASGSCGGGGGGGSGGSVWLQTPGAITGAGSVDVSGGAGGTSVAGGAFCTTANGGAGSRGVFRFDSATGTHTVAAVTPSDAPDPEPAFSVSIAAGQTYQVVSQPFRLSFDGTDFVKISAPSETTGCGTDGALTMTYEGSHDGSTFPASVSGADIQQLSQYRFIRFKASIATTGANPPCLTALSIDYEPADFTDYELKGGLFCGSIRNKNQSGSAPPGSALGDLFVLSLALGWVWKMRKKPVHGRPVSDPQAS